MKPILEATPIPIRAVPAPPQLPTATGEVESNREFERTSGYQSAVESTYWYMLAMLILGLYAAFWIIVMAQNSP